MWWSRREVKCEECLSGHFDRYFDVECHKNELLRNLKFVIWWAPESQNCGIFNADHHCPFYEPR